MPAVSMSPPERALIVWMRLAEYRALAQAWWQLRQERELAIIRAENGVPFGPHRDHRADIYHPPAEPKGTLVFFHGGGWTAGTRRMVEPLGREMALRGYLFICPDYRLIPYATVDEATSDVIRAWEWARALAIRLGCPATRIALGGESAGSHLSTRALLLLAETSRELPSAHVAVFGPHDMASFLDKASPFVRSALRVLRHPHSSLKDATPRLSNLGREWPNAVALLTVHGNRDILVPYRMSLALHEHARKAGAAAEHVRIAGAPHGFINIPRSEFGWPAVQAIDRFLDERFRTASTARSIA